MIKRTLFLVFITTSLNVSAQLTVTNSSYIYVDGDGFTEGSDVAPIFVTDAVNLVGTNSNIYLRNEAQLIQGNAASANSGIGELSIQQTGTANTFAYNYWCSPVGNNSAATGNEDARATLIDDSTGLISSNDAVFISGHDGVSSPLQIPRRWLYSYVASDEYSEWIDLDENSAIAPGLGFTMKGIEDGGQLYDFRGKANNGTITNSILADNFTLIGNPYPSAIDALLLIHDADNANIGTDGDFLPVTTGALYYWEQQPTDHFTENYIGGYAAYTISSGGAPSFVPAQFFAYDSSGNEIPLPPPGSTGSKVAGRYIPIGQGFMVEGSPTTPANSLVYTKNTHRVFHKESSGDSAFFRTSNTDVAREDSSSEAIEYDDNGLAILPDDFKRFRLNVLFNNNFKRQLLQNFHNTATDGFDYGLEAPISSDSATDAFWTQNDEAMVIQAHSFDIEKRIPVIIKAENQQNIDFSIFDIQNFEASQPIYVHDIENDIYVDLRAQNYSINLQAGNYTDRFEITFQESEALNIEEIADEDFIVFQNTKNAELTILNPNGLDIKSVTLFDVTGKLVIDAKNLGTQNDYRFSTKSLSEGVYVATVTVDNNQATSKKVMIKN
ncbi:MAG: hypothetical protein ACI8QQ_001536 [Psychroserpens sp.]|jgi:hypothetical protein